MLTNISLFFARIELSLTDSEEHKTGRGHNTKLREYEPRAGIISCALISAETSDRAKHRGSKGSWEGERWRRPREGAQETKGLGDQGRGNMRNEQLGLEFITKGG